jgi:uncharacterized iron-regulated membrane protein
MNVLKRFIHRPQQVWLRRALFQVHLWTGVAVALYIIAIGVSGSILVFKEELLPSPPMARPSVYDRGCSENNLAHVIADVAAAHPTREVFLVACPTDATPFYMTTIREKGKGRDAEQETVFSHPVSLQIFGTADRDDSWVEWMEDFHVNLLLGRTGRIWNGIGGITLLVLCISGFVLWWPGIKRWTRALLVDFRRGWKRINFDLHSATGFWTLSIVSIWAISGIYFAWPQLSHAFVSRFSPVITAKYPGTKVPPAPKGALIQPDLEGILKDARARTPHGVLAGVFYPSPGFNAFTVYMARERVGDYSSTDFLYYNAVTNKHASTWHRGQNQTAGDWIIWLMAPLHFGTSWGLAVKIIWAVLGLSLPILTITGLLMYWNRWLSKKWKRLTGAHAAVADKRISVENEDSVLARR